MKLRAIIVGGGCFVIGLIVSGWALSAYMDRHKAQKWNLVTAEITSSKVISWKSSKGSTAFRPCINYQYAVNGVSYIGETVRFGPEAVNRDEAEEAVRKFFVGYKPIVYVNPDNASESVLDRDSVTGAVIWQLSVGIGFTVIGLFLAVVLWGILIICDLI
jgi:hypothetical protein